MSDGMSDTSPRNDPLPNERIPEEDIAFLLSRRYANRSGYTRDMDYDKPRNFTHLKAKTKLEIFFQQLRNKKLMIIISKLFLVCGLASLIVTLLMLFTCFNLPDNETPLRVSIPFFSAGFFLITSLLLWVLRSTPKIVSAIWKWIIE